MKLHLSGRCFAYRRGVLVGMGMPSNFQESDGGHHCHVKNAVKDSAGTIQWSPVDKGYVDWAAQFAALAKVGYSDAVNLETHWKGGGTPEESSRISWAGMKSDLQQAQLA